MPITGNLTVDYAEPSRFKGYPKNARVHSESQIEEIEELIKKFGFTNPLLVDEDDIIIAGHGRQSAAINLRLNAVPFIVLSGLTDIEKRALRIADNKIALNAAWDLHLLRAELSDLEGDLQSLVGFTLDELAEIFQPPPPDDEPPGSFPESDEDIEVEHVCPRCGFRWSGSSAAPVEDEDEPEEERGNDE